jgi:hypothetical protein
VSDDPNAPDFAMQRAVEILATIYERNRERRDAPAPPMDKPILLFNETIALEVGATTRESVERELGIAYAYPARGWHTYCCGGRAGTREFLSLFYSEGRLASAELYVPKSERAPALAKRDLHFRFVPGEIALGMPTTALSENFEHVSAVAEKLGAFTEIFGARFPGGSAYAMGNDGTIERLALYVLK